ncbi:glycosyl hydrolase [Aspergillus insuetus]
MLQNPIIPGFAPDPSIVRIDHFLVTSSFHLFPGLPIDSSKDLVSWKQIGLSVTAREPTHLRPTFSIGNAINWTFQLSLADARIDPDLFCDDDGRAYIPGSSWKTDPGTIDCYEIDLQAGRKVSPQQVMWEGHTRAIPEGPHIYKYSKWYYLLASKDGPMRITRSFLVCLAARKDQAGRCIMGRETFLTLVQWQVDSWPVIEQPLLLDLVWIRDPDLGCYEVLEDGRIIKIRPSSWDIHDCIGPISFDPLFTAAKGVVAGLEYYKDEHRYARIAFDYTTSTIFVETQKASEVPATNARTGKLTTEITPGMEIHFCIKHSEASLEFGYYLGEIFHNGWNLIATMDTLELTDRAFTGPCIGIFSTARNADAVWCGTFSLWIAGISAIAIPK